jgi:hypothetical protein
MNNLLEYSKYDPRKEYKTEDRRDLDIEKVRKSKEYRSIIDLGFKEVHSHQQDLNNTLKFTRTKHKEKEKGHGDVFYTIHPTGKVRRYNPVKNEDNPGERMEGNGNDIKDFGKPFSRPSEYAKGLRYLWQYIKRKQERGNYRIYHLPKWKAYSGHQ